MSITEQSIRLAQQAKEEVTQIVIAYHDSTELYGGYPPAWIWLPDYLIVAYMGYGNKSQIAAYRWSDLITLWYESKSASEDAPYGDVQTDDMFRECLPFIEIE